MTGSRERDARVRGWTAPHRRRGLTELAWIVGACGALVVVTILSGADDQLLTELTAALDSRELAGIAVLVALLLLATAGIALLRALDARRAFRALQHLERHDRLTGLPNRRFLDEGFEELAAEARRRRRRIAVLSLDLKGFGRVNEIYGMEVGDELMQALVERLQRGVEDGVIVRYGGDEFVVIVPDVADTPSVERIARRLARIVETPFERGEELLRLNASIGIALSEERCSRPRELLRDADTARYLARTRGPGSYVVFDRSMEQSLTPSTAERRLRRALEQGEFRLVYQPIVSLWTRRMVGVEALLRWEDPNRGVIGPDEFIPALEQSGLIVPVGNWVLEEVCRQTRSWHDRFPDRPSLNVKVNTTARQLAQTDFTRMLRHSLEVTGADPDRICLEITEGALTHDLVTAWSTLREVKELGLSLALDDFGTGYSSLSYLRRFALDLLKIDNSFVGGLGRSREDETIVEHVVAMAKALGIVTVAEGVETEEQVDHLRALNCDLAQGYHFSQPQPPQVIEQLLARDDGDGEWQPPASQQTEAAPVVEIPRFRDPAVRALD